MLRLAALSAARRGGSSSTRGARLVVDHAKLDESAAAATAAATAAAAMPSSSSSSSFFSLSVRSFAARAAPAEGGDDRKAATRNAVLVKALTPQALPPPPPQLSADEALEASEMAKKYSRAKMAAHRQRQRDLSQKLQLKLAAVAALPEGPLRDAALEPDYTPFPSSRAVWTDTPPIAGFASGGGMGGSGESKDDAGARPVGAGRRRK